MRRSICGPVAPRLRATLNQFGSILFTPLAVENMIGQTAAITMRKMIAASQLSNARTAIGIQANGLIILRNWKGTFATFIAVATYPIITPTGTPMAIAQVKPAKIRYKLEATVTTNSPELMSLYRAAKVGAGAKSANAIMSGSLAIR